MRRVGVWICGRPSDGVVDMGLIDQAQADEWYRVYYAHAVMIPKRSKVFLGCE